MPDHWYPSNPQQKAKVDEYLEWHHNGIRLGAGGYIYRKYASPMMGKPIPDELVQASLLTANTSMRLIQDYWLEGGKRRYLCGDQMSLADISCACELHEAKFIKVIDWNKYPVVSEWFDRMMELPEMKEADRLLKQRLEEFPFAAEARL